MDARRPPIRHALKADATADSPVLPRPPARVGVRRAGADAPSSSRGAAPAGLPGFAMLSGTIVEVTDEWLRVHQSYRFGDAAPMSYSLRWPIPPVRVIGSLQAGRHTDFLAPDWLVRDKQAEIHKLARHAKQRQSVSPDAIAFL